MINNKLDQLLLVYGFLPFALLIKRYEEKQDFEKCELLFQTIVRANDKLNLDLPTKYNDLSVEYFFEQMRSLGFQGNIAFGNLEAQVEKLEINLNPLQRINKYRQSLYKLYQEEKFLEMNYFICLEQMGFNTPKTFEAYLKEKKYKFKVKKSFFHDNEIKNQRHIIIFKNL